VSQPGLTASTGNVAFRLSDARWCGASLAAYLSPILVLAVVVALPPFWSWQFGTIADGFETGFYILCTALVFLVTLLLVRAQGRVKAIADGLEKQARVRTHELECAYDDLKQQIRSRKMAEEAMRHLEKMEIIGQLGGSIAHDFNNALTAVIGNLDLLKMRISDARDLQLLQGSYNAAQRGTRLSRQLLAYARKEPPQLKRNAMDCIIAGLADLLPATMGSTIKVEIQLQPALWPVFVDTSQIETAILNVAINARDAMPDGGTLRLEAVNQSIGSVGQGPDSLTPGDYVVVSISDTGTGLSEEVARHAFEPFYTTKEPGKGTGLGLSQVYRHAVECGGTATLEGAVGRGTVVRLYLPRAQP
jgi:signal transduction histidine kinase